jgi:hypothetical protein
MYCNICCIYGHTLESCPLSIPSSNAVFDDPVHEYTDPADVNNYVEVLDNRDCIASTLVANGGTPMICQEKGRKEMRDYHENKRRLSELLKKKGFTLLLVKYGPDPQEKQEASVENATSAKGKEKPAKQAKPSPFKKANTATGS